MNIFHLCDCEVKNEVLNNMENSAYLKCSNIIHLFVHTMHDKIQQMESHARNVLRWILIYNL